MARYGVASHFTADGLDPEHWGSPKIAWPQSTGALSCSRRGTILSSRARNISACSWRCGDAGQVSQPAEAQLGPPPKHSPSPKHRDRHRVNWGTETCHASVGGAPEHDCTTAETDVWGYSYKQGWRNLKPAGYFSSSSFLRWIRSKVHWMVLTFFKRLLGFGMHCFQGSIWFWEPYSARQPCLLYFFVFTVNSYWLDREFQDILKQE